MVNSMSETAGKLTLQSGFDDIEAAPMEYVLPYDFSHKEFSNNQTACMVISSTNL